MKVAFGLALLFAGLAHAGPCLKYYRPVVLQGVLTSETFPGPPNYESISAGDEAETYFFITLKKAVCVTQGAGDFDPAIGEIDTFQLLFTPYAEETSYKELRPYLNHVVKCTGSLLGASTGHHHSAALLDGATCHAT